MLTPLSSPPVEIAIRFFGLILPDQGYYIAAIRRATGFKNEFASTLEELWAIIENADLEGHAAYHACASFKEPHNDAPGIPQAQRRFGRTKHNVLGAKAFWLDLDVGPEKAYSDQDLAAAALANFCNVLKLPLSIIVRSGSGLHVYWPLQQTLDRDTWERYASGLKNLCQQYGLEVDPPRTADIASILRTPGTTNRKRSKAVECDPEYLEIHPYAIEQFEVFAAHADMPPSSKHAAAALVLPDKIPEYLLRDKPPHIVSALQKQITAYAPARGLQVAERCEQVRALRESEGNLPEPQWYAALGVLAFCDDGDQLAHEWSSGDGRYTEHETHERLERLRQFGPTTCTKFHGLDAVICENCPWWGKIKSPIQLGRECDVGAENRKSATANEGKEPNWFADEVNYSNTDTDPFPLRWHGEKDSGANRPWLVKKLLPTSGVGLISGQWGTGKTFVAIELAVSVMIGNQFAGRHVARKGGVLFIAAEGASEVPIRLNGLAETKFPDHKGKLPFAWAESSPTLTDKGAIEQLVRIAKKASDQMRSNFRVELVLIILDTMSAAAGFKDENASAEGQVVMNALNELAKRTGSLVMACDHFGKATETGTRGTSAKEASADVVVACLGDKTQTGAVSNLRIGVRKLRGGATGAETAFTLRTVDMGVDEDGEPITTCIIEWSSATIAPPVEATKGKGWSKSTSRFRSALLTTLKEHGTYQQPQPDGARVFAVELYKVRAEFNERYPLEEGNRKRQLNTRSQNFKRSIETAEDKGLIGGREIDGTFMVWLTRPEDEGVQLPKVPSGQGGP
jgi:hypothetical protein